MAKFRIFFGKKKITIVPPRLKLYVGSTQVSKLYLGSTEITVAYVGSNSLN